MSEIQAGPTSEYETWRVKPRLPGCEQNSDALPDVALDAVRFTKLCGFAAVDIQTAGILCAQRTRWDARRDGMNDYKVIFQVSGRSTLVQDERTTKLAAGDLGLIDVTRPIDLIPQGEPGRWIGLHLPRQSLMSHLGFEPQGGLCWRGDALPGRFLRRFLEDILDESDVTLGAAEHYMQLAVYNLVGALFGASELPRHFSQGDKLFMRVCGIIKRHFWNPDVGPVEVAAEAGISVRYLQKLFATRGTTYGHFIRSFRLDHAAHLLNRRTSMKTNLPLVEVAYACGYRDYTHFARNFRARFGRTPGALGECVTLSPRLAVEVSPAGKPFS